MKEGAADFVGKPFNRDHLLLSVSRALEGKQLREEVRQLRRKAAGVERPLIAASDAMRRVLEIADRVAGSDATVLVTGETGTGKELVARRVHARSERSDAPFVAINCAAVPGDLLESELFGHEKGAFTGATRAREGRFRQADGGTLFLDEIGELPGPLQGKLLRVLQERVVDVVGGDKPVPVDVRMVAATNRDLAAMAREGSFREDLLYRLNVLEVRVPPLRERPAEIEPLVRHFVERFAKGRDLSVPDDVMAELRSRPWPGNVRQLENACERLVILCPGDTLRVDDLPPREGGSASEPSAAWPELPPEGLSLVDLEKRVIERVLALKNGNVTQAAQYLECAEARARVPNGQIWDPPRLRARTHRRPPSRSAAGAERQGAAAAATGLALDVAVRVAADLGGGRAALRNQQRLGVDARRAPSIVLLADHRRGVLRREPRWARGRTGGQRHLPATRLHSPRSLGAHGSRRHGAQGAGSRAVQHRWRCGWGAGGSGAAAACGAFSSAGRAATASGPAGQGRAAERPGRGGRWRCTRDQEPASFSEGNRGDHRSADRARQRGAAHVGASRGGARALAPHCRSLRFVREAAAAGLGEARSGGGRDALDGSRGSGRAQAWHRAPCGAPRRARICSRRPGSADPGRAQHRAQRHARGG